MSNQTVAAMQAVQNRVPQVNIEENTELDALQLAQNRGQLVQYSEELRESQKKNLGFDKLSLETPQFNGLFEDSNRAVGIARELGALLIVMGAKQRQASRTSRHLERDLMVDTIRQQAKKIKDAALKNFLGSIAAGSLQIVGGLFQASMATASFNAPNPIGMDSIGRAGAQVFGAVGSITQGVFEFGASMDREAQKRLEADQQVFQFSQENERELMDTMMRLTMDTLKTVEGVQSSGHGVVSKILSMV